jgi:hypothetical protein
MRNAALRLVTPSGDIPTVTPRRGKNAEYRTREHLTESEVERLIEATSSHRDATMIYWPSGMACERLNSWTCVGIRSIFRQASCTSAGPRRARQQLTR